jgi:hypothetical protein
MTLKVILQWLKKSGIKVNEEKTELCIIHRNMPAQVNVRIGNSLVKSKNEINVPGVLFDSRLQCSNHIDKAIVKANKALNAIKLIRYFF